MGLVLHSYIQPRYSQAGLNPCWEQAWLQQRAASFVFAFDDKEPALPSVVFYSSANRELLPALRLSPFPSTAATATWIWEASDFSQMEKHFYPQQKIWEGRCEETTLGPLQPRCFESPVWTWQSLRSREPFNQGSALTSLWSRWGCTQAILTLYGPLAEYFRSWGRLEMPYRQRGLSKCVWQTPTPVSQQGLLVTINLLLGFFLQNMDSWGIRVTHFSLHVCLILMLQKLFKALKNNDCFIIVGVCPSMHRLPCLRRYSDRSWTHSISRGSNRVGWQENSQLPRKFWDFSFICIKLGQGTQILYLVLFYPSIPKIFVLLPTQFQFSIL